MLFAKEMMIVDSEKIGSTICTLRREQGMTQRELAELLHVSSKAVSKWERGQGIPDVSLLERLAEVLDVTVEQILSGKLPAKRKDSGNIARMKFYLCSHCGNVLMGTGECHPVCCGRRLTPAVAKLPDDAHTLCVEQVEVDRYVTTKHPMDKGHYLQFAALVGADRMEFVRLYPEQDGAFRLTGLNRGTLYYSCSEHGVFCMKI